MAGFYPDAPGVRMAYDKDGTAGYVLDIQSPSIDRALTLAELAEMNDEDTGSVAVGHTNDTSGPCLIFPELRDITHIFSSLAATAQGSVDSTNGLDGTWVNLAPALPGSASRPGYRTAITTITSGGTGLKAIRFSGFGNRNQEVLHLYGGFAAGANPDRLRLWHPTLDQALSVTPAFLDWGDVLQNSFETRQFRVKNNSATLTANGIVISLEVNTDAAPTLIGQFQFSHGGGAFANTVDIGNLAPGAISTPISIQRSTSATAALWLWAARVAAIPTSMT